MPFKKIRSVSVEGKVTIPKELRDKYKINEYVEITEKKGYIVVKPHRY